MVSGRLSKRWRRIDGGDGAEVSTDTTPVAMRSRMVSTYRAASPPECFRSTPTFDRSSFRDSRQLTGHRIERFEKGAEKLVVTLRLDALSETPANLARCG